MKKITIVIATNNPHKVDEINSIAGDQIKIISLKEAGIDLDIPEPHATIEENASEKAKTIFKLTNQNCFGEDTGLEVDALNGEPGVKSARYAGEDKNFEANIQKLLDKLKDIENRDAKFKTIISLLWNGEEYFFEGIVKGKIIKERKGTNGFGYDSVFIPVGSEKTFAEMEMSEKNVFSHRKKAVEQLLAFFKKELL